jgi:hypothetical protein
MPSAKQNPLRHFCVEVLPTIPEEDHLYYFVDAEDNERALQALHLRPTAIDDVSITDPPNQFYLIDYRAKTGTKTIIVIADSEWDAEYGFRLEIVQAQKEGKVPSTLDPDKITILDMSIPQSGDSFLWSNGRLTQRQRIR